MRLALQIHTGTVRRFGFGGPWMKGKKKGQLHLFMIWDEDWNIIRLSKPFKFMAAQIEFNTGLAIKDDNFLITFGYQDNSAFVLRMNKDTLNKLTWTKYQ